MSPERMLQIKGYDVSKYVPGSMDCDGYYMTWTEKCSKRCKHTSNGCHHARSGIAPKPWEDRDE